MELLDKLSLYRRVFGGAWLANAFLGLRSTAPVEVALRPRGLSHPLHLRLKTSDVATYVKVFLEEEYAFALPAEPRVVVDAGANVGVSAVWFASRWPGARILALEPEPTNFALLRRNAAPYPGVVPIQAALWDRDGTVALVDPGLGHWAFRVGPLDGAGGPASAPVAAVTLGSLLGRYGVERVDLLKVDVEGAEVEVFGGARAWIDRVESIAVELHDRMRPGCSRAVFGATAGFEHEAWRGENLFLSRAAPPPGTGAA